jgi:hypothetical protein
MKLEISGKIFEKIEILKYQISRKSVLWKPSCFMREDGRKDRRTDITKLIVAFHNFANAPKNPYNSGLYASEMLKFIDSSQFIIICFSESHSASCNYISLALNKHNEMFHDPDRQTAIIHAVSLQYKQC